MASEGTRDLVSEARSFTSSLSNVFLLKKRDQQSKHLLEKAQTLIEALIAENQKMSSGSSTPRQIRNAGGMGQLWVKLDELKRENDDLRRQKGRSSDDRSSSPKDRVDSVGLWLPMLKQLFKQCLPLDESGHLGALKERQGPGDVIINDLQRTKSENDILKQQVTQLQKSVRELQAVNNTLQDEYKRTKAALDAAQRSAEKARQDCKRLEASFTSAKTENDSLKQKMTSSVKPMMRTDNRMTENINERCRPSTVALRYDTLESQQWVDAKEAIEDSCGLEMEEKQVVHLLCQGLMSTYDAAKQLFTNVEHVIGELLKQPTLATTIIESRLVGTDCINVLPEEMTDIVKQKLRNASHALDNNILCTMAKEKQDSGTRDVLQNLSSNKDVSNYLQECANISWQMVVQSPSMRLTTDDSKFDDVKHKLWWSCDQSCAHTVDMFVWPVLYDYEGGNILVKGCVYAS